MEHRFSFKLKETPRTWTKEEWKASDHFLRSARRVVEHELEKQGYEKLLMDYILFGGKL